jgi:NarL family two-component system sensor histidine kinase YdfH
MDPTMPPKSQFAGLPFYIFISLLLGMLAVFGALAVGRANPIPLAIAYIFLFGAHIGLYWLNLRHHPNRRWIIFYYLIQALLIVSLASFSYGGDNVRVSVLGSTTMCMIGESLGLWGNTRRSLLLGLVYAGLAMVLLFVLVGRNDFGAALSNLLVNGVFIVLFMVVLNQQFVEREKALELAERLESANAQLAANAARIESLTLQNERQRMARELHDTLAQGLAGLVLQLEAVKAHLASQHAERASAIVDQALARARGTLAESRAAIDDLRLAPADLADRVRENVDRFAGATGIRCEEEISVQDNRLSAAAADHAISILSEALANVARHAQADQVKVRFVLQRDELELEVLDNGKGFDVNGQSSTGHYGLLGMRERARLTGGLLTVESSSQSGTRVRFTVRNLQGAERP